MDCIFCRIIQGQIPGKVIYEAKEAIGILDVNPISPGHAMVLPKIHAASVLDLPDEKVGPVFLAVKEVAAILKEKLDPDGFTYGINQGEVSGQAVRHLHIHIVPRWRNDGGTTFHGIVNNPPKESLDEMIKKIKGH